jgi:hypothetical protein
VLDDTLYAVDFPRTIRPYPNGFAISAVSTDAS